MKHWMKNLFITFVTVITFGLVTPFQSYASNDRVSDTQDESNDHQQVEIKKIHSYSQEELYAHFIEKAKAQSYLKFGEKILLQIEKPFQHEILPAIENAISEILEQIPSEELSNLAITEWPGDQYHEKIFNIYNRVTLKDIARFHVSRLYIPKEGFVFQFHYHMNQDQFEKHYNLGSIYWGKNQPPKWMSGK